VDRDAIERRDFPVGRRGYDQAAVDAHLRRVADELERLRHRPSTTPLAADTSEQVRVILEAAEASAAQLRDDAGRRAGEHVQRVEDAAGGMLSRLGELERELGGLLDALRRSGERLTEGLARLHEQVGEAGGAPPAVEGEPEDFAGAARAATTGAADDESSAADEPDQPAADIADDASAAGTTARGESVGDTAAEEQMPDGRADGDEAGARLIALNMALSGTPREETARYLAEHFRLADPEALLDDVYARAGR
jgi:DivIVA domain-containing protein